MDETIESVRRNAALPEIYRQRQYERERPRELEDSPTPLERPVEEGKGIFVDIYV